MVRHMTGSLASVVFLITFVTHTTAGQPYGIQQTNFAPSEPRRIENESARPIQAQTLTYQNQTAQGPAVSPTGHHHYPPAPVPYSPGPGAVVTGGQYPYLDAPLYPSPVQTVPTYVGGTQITNQAFAPHEMLYAHDYHSMYGPFYWKVHGKYVLTPFGVRSHEQWALQGTEVNVKYRSQKPLFSGFHAPRGFAGTGGWTNVWPN